MSPCPDKHEESPNELKNNDHSRNKPDGWILAIGIVVFMGLLISIFLPHPQDKEIFSYTVGSDPFTDYLIRNGYPLKEFDKYIEEIKKNGKVQDHKISVLIGHYYYTDLVIAAIYTDKYNSLNHIIFIESEFYDSLADSNKKALLSHEIGHLVKPKKISNRQVTRLVDRIIIDQMNADEFALQSVGADEMIDLLKKIRDYNPEFSQRTDNLQMLRKLFQKN